MSPKPAASAVMRSRESSVAPISNCSSDSGGWFFTARNPTLSPRQRSRKLRPHMTEPGTGGGLRNTVYRKSTRSARRMTASRRLIYRIFIVPLGVGLIRFWWRLGRVVRVEGMEHLEAALAQAPSFVPCYWHQHQLF